MGIRCALCGAVLLESRYVIPKLANYAPDRSRRRYPSDEPGSSSAQNIHFTASDWNRCKKTEGTFWELIPTNILACLYPHQQQGLVFLWENLTGSIKVSQLQDLDQCKGGGCIISHAPGTGKTLLTIAFIESFLKKFPNCCPLVVAPASMLLTWEAEFKKWQLGFSFLSLNNSKTKSSNLNWNHANIRAMKISSWRNGGSVLGVSYNLFELLARNAKDAKLERMGNLLLDVPRLVMLDEGHTPRNQTSGIWNTLLKLKTRNRVILSGTPFQNNFKELFNTLRLVRPEAAVAIENKHFYAAMMKVKDNATTAEEMIEKLKDIISPFVHVHKGHILHSKLPGLQQNIILLNPPPLQKIFIEKLDDLASMNTFEYEPIVVSASLHPSLLIDCSLLWKEENSMNKKLLEEVRLHPDVGAKTRFVMELIRLSIALDERVLIFSQYMQPLELLEQQIAFNFSWDVGREIMFIRWNTLQKHRQTIINDFNDQNSRAKVLLASTKYCSEGIHLVGASRVVLLDVVWNPSVEKQAISRAYRLGQKKVVHTYHLMTSGTTEEEKYNRQVEKGRVGELVFSSSEEAKKKEKAAAMGVPDDILQQMVEHQHLKDLFRKIRNPEHHGFD